MSRNRPNLPAAELDRRITALAKELEPMTQRAVDILVSELHERRRAAKTPEEKEKAETLCWLYDQANARARVRA